jgi:hypothetical protein
MQCMVQQKQTWLMNCKFPMAFCSGSITYSYLLIENLLTKSTLIVKKNSMEISMIINYIEDAYDSVSNQDRYKKLN